MADTKITGLLSPQVTTNPATDVLPIVNIADTLMASSGSTRKITVNQILGSGGTATLASATITGDLTVDTSTLKVDSTLNKVGIGVATLTGLSTLNVAGDVGITSDLVLKNSGGTAQGYIFGSSGLNYRVIAGQPHVWQEGGSDLMRLNSTGLGVGVAGGSIVARMHVKAGSFQTPLIVDTLGYYQINMQLNGVSRGQIFADATNCFAVQDSTNSFTRFIVTDSGNIGVGVTPSASWVTYKALEFDTGIVSGSSSMALNRNTYFDGVNWRYKVTTSFGISQYQLSGNGSHIWNIASSGSVGAAINGGTGAWTQAMTLDASGNLLVGTTTNTNSSRVFARGTGGATTLAIQSSTGDTANPGLLVGKFDNNSTTSQILVRFTINDNAAGSGQITANGANAAAFGTFSDSRLKENIASIPSQLEKIVSLRPVEFDFKNGSGHQIGFVAQEMQEVYPDVVGEQDGFLTVTGWSKTEARLVSAIKELAAKVQALEAKLA
jgi:hypothetical protein